MNTPPLMWAILATIALAVVWYTFIDPYLRFRKTVAANTAKNLAVAHAIMRRNEALVEAIYADAASLDAVDMEALLANAHEQFERAMKQVDLAIRLDAKKERVARRKYRTQRLGGI